MSSEFESFSQYASMSVDAKEAATKGHAIARGRFETLLHYASNHAGAPLGKTPARVLAALAAEAETVFADEPGKNSIRAAA